MPVAAGNPLYNTAVVFCRGRVLGIVPKTYLPNYGEFYESRWFASGTDFDGRQRDAMRAAGSDVDGTAFRR